MHGFSPSIISILLHILVETPAGLNFLFRPSYTLSSASHDARPVIRQYGLLLLVLNSLLGLLLMDFYHGSSTFMNLREATRAVSMEKQSYIDEQTLESVCGLLFLYHIVPFWRALSSHYSSHPGGKGAYGGPLVIAAAHGVVGAGLLGITLQYGARFTRLQSKL